MRRNACAHTNEAGVMNYDVIAYGSVCRDVKLHDLPVCFRSIYLEGVEGKEKFRWSLLLSITTV
jgi:hypothetical protein